MEAYTIDTMYEPKTPQHRAIKQLVDPDAAFASFSLMDCRDYCLSEYTFRQRHRSMWRGTGRHRSTPLNTVRGSSGDCESLRPQGASFVVYRGHASRWKDDSSTSRKYASRKILPTPSTASAFCDLDSHPSMSARLPLEDAPCIHHTIVILRQTVRQEAGLVMSFTLR